MSSLPESSEKSPDFAVFGAQLSEMLGKFNEMSIEMATQRCMIDQLVANNRGSVQNNPTSAIDNLLKHGNQVPLTSNIPTTSPLPVASAPESVFNPDATHIRPNNILPQTHPQASLGMPPHVQGPHYHKPEPFVWEATSQGNLGMDEYATPIDKELLKRLDRFDEFIRKNQGTNKPGGLDYDDLCLFPDMRLPFGFKAPKFSKFDGTGNPKTHLKMFANKLGKPVDDENLPIRLFPESLEGDALDWYANLKPQEISTWLDLSTAFVKQYEFNCELAPTRTTLENTKKKPSEDHKSYAKRWRKIAAKVEPPMTEDEMVRTFIKAHDPPYFEEIFRMTGSSFAAIVNKLEEYDEFVKAGKIVNVTALKLQLEALQGQNNNGKRSLFKKKEEESAFVWDQGPNFRPRARNYSYSTQYPPYLEPQPVYQTTTQLPFQAPRSNFQNHPRPPYNPRPPPQNIAHPGQNSFHDNGGQTQKPPRTFTNLGRPIDQLYEQLKAANKIGTLPVLTYANGFPRGYDPRATCAYHSGSAGHSTASCWALKHKIQDMIDAGDIVLRRSGGEVGPNVNQNPLPNHGNNVGMITSEHEGDSVSELPTTLKGPY